MIVRIVYCILDRANANRFIGGPISGIFAGQGDSGDETTLSWVLISCLSGFQPPLSDRYAGGSHLQQNPPKLRLLTTAAPQRSREVATG